jgi:purine-binding chemotaxis protein CheW
MPSFVTGVSVIRGAAVPVLDAGALFGSAAPSAPARFVVIRTGGRRLALAVEGVVGVREIRGAALQALPSILGEASHETVAAIGTLDAELLVVLRAARILPESTWDAFALASREVPP